jgi:hypothetical protein
MKAKVAGHHSTPQSGVEAVEDVYAHSNLNGYGKGVNSALRAVSMLSRRDW